MPTARREIERAMQEAGPHGVAAVNAPDRKPYHAEKARGGEIILRKRWQKIVFFGALALAVLLGFFFSLWGR
jgi:hypothetical protein